MKTKRIISFLMCSVLLLASIPVFSFAENEALKLTVTTDTHLYWGEDYSSVPENDETFRYTAGMLDEDLFYYATTQGQMNYESSAIMKSMLRSFEESDSDILLIAGDLTNGFRTSHNKMAELLKEVESKGKKVFVTVGNHDCSKASDEKYIDIEEFKDIYADFGFNEALYKDTSSASYSVDLSDDYRLLAIDSCIYGEDNGKIDSSVLSWIEEQVKIAKADGKHLIAMMHHSLLNHFYVQPMIKNSTSVAEKFADWGIKFVFTGHIHANDISSAETKKGNVVYDIQTGSLISSPNAYRYVTVDETKFDIQSRFVTKIDKNDLPGGYSAEQFERITTDFPSYADSYFEAGVCCWLNRYIGSAGKVGKMLKLKEDSKAYAALDSLMLNIGDALNTPIYEKDANGRTSIEALAKSAGFTIPESRFTMPYQAAASIMGSFFKGDEETILSADDVDVLFSCIKAVLAESVKNIMFGSKISTAFDSLAKKVTGISPKNSCESTLLKINYADNLATKLADALILTLTDGLTKDLSSPADVNVTLDSFDGISKESTPLPLSTFGKILQFFRNLFIKVKDIIF